MTAWRRALVLVGILWCLYLFTTTRSTLWNRDEARYATAVLEMIDSGNYLYPTFNHELRPHKPILIYWLMSVAVRVFGAAEFAVRCVSTLCVAASCMMVFAIGRHLFSSRSGQWAAAILGTSPMVMLSGTAATTDAALMAAILTSLVPFVWTYTDGSRWWHAPVMGTGIGAALLIKGPVGLLAPMLSMIVTIVLARGRSRLDRQSWITVVAASVLGIFLFLVWAIPANAATGGEYARVGFVEGLSKRLFTAMEGHGGGSHDYLLYLPYYLVVVSLASFPWLVFLPGAARTAAGGRISGRSGHDANGWARSGPGIRVLLAGMILPTLVLMTLVTTKLPHYVLPVFPWLALMYAGALETASHGEASRRDRAWFRHGVWGYGLVAISVGVALLAAPMRLPDLAPARVPLSAAGSVVLAGAAMVLIAQWRGQFRCAARIVLFGALAWWVIVAALVLPALESIVKPDTRLARAVAGHIGPETPVALYGWYEPALHFYLGGRPIERIYSPQHLLRWAREPGSGLIVTTRRALDQVELHHGSLGLREIGSERGISHVDGRRVELVALFR
jgi:4-amino-4-deoxy-L-arabinose transferase-like glycosyltransferase